MSTNPGTPAVGRIRILLVDDHPVVREGVRSLLTRQPDMEVVGESGDGRSAVRMARQLMPDVVIMDIGMQDLNGIDATRQITTDLMAPKVLCLSVHREKAMVAAMLRAGATGYVLKTSVAPVLAEAVRAVAAGETYLCPPIATDIVEHHVRTGHEGGAGSAFRALSPREREVLQLIAEGHATKEVASRMCLSPKTVLAHRATLMRKLGVESSHALVSYALREGIIEL